MIDFKLKPKEGATMFVKDKKQRADFVRKSEAGKQAARQRLEREKFATQVNAKILAALRALAENEGRQLQALVEEALSDLIEKHTRAKPRPHVMGAYLASHEKYGPLYKKLAE
jgi:hypothetical protein